MQKMNIANIAGGALVEQVDIEIKRVLENIMDPNTGLMTKRKITIVLDFKCDEKRDVVDVSFLTKSVLAPQRAIEAKIAFDMNSNGEIVAEELRKNSMKGQWVVDSNGEFVEPETRASSGNMSRIVNIK